MITLGTAACVSQLPAGFTLMHPNTTQEFRFPKSLFPTKTIKPFTFFFFIICGPWATVIHVNQSCMLC